jgi:D-amino peptidase
VSAFPRPLEAIFIMNVLLLVDLEGVVGVDQVGDLIEGQPGFPRAQVLLASEITAACDGLRRGATGAGEIVISDSHHGGGPTVDPRMLAGLGPGVRVHRGDDDYGAALLEEVQAVACLGMHAGARGFAPHTLDLTCVWELDGQPLSEADLLLGVAAERGLPAVFLAGDDALDPRGLPFVPTKTALSPVAARSRPLLDVLGEIRRAAGGKPVPSPALPAGAPLAVRFRSRWMAERAEQIGHRRLDETAVAIAGNSLETTIRAGRDLIPRATMPMIAALRRDGIAEDVAALANRGFERRPPPGRQPEARRALEALLARTDRANGADDWARALRALTLHMLEGHAPAFFAAHQLGPVLAQAQRDLVSIPIEFPLALEPEQALARLDAVYVLHERGSPVRPDGDALARYIVAWRDRDPLHAWLMGELGRQIGLPPPPPPERPFRPDHRIRDLYRVTHLFLLATRYLRHPLPATSWESFTEQLLLAAPVLVEQGFLDLAAEVAICLQLAGEDHAPERSRILAALAVHQRADGSVIQLGDPDLDAQQRFRDETHCTAAALLAFATATGSLVTSGRFRGNAG